MTKENHKEEREVVKSPAFANTNTTNCRVADLVAKTARVSIKDTIRVLLAFDTVADFLNISTETLLEERMSRQKATKEQSVDCERAYAMMREHLIRQGEPDWLDTLRNNAA